MGLLNVFLIYNVLNGLLLLNTGLFKFYGINVQDASYMLIHGAEASTGCPCNLCAAVTYCRNMGYTIVPVGIPGHDMTSLMLSGNSIGHLYGNDFRDMNALQRLYLENNNIRNMDRYTFTGLLNLEALHLDNNQLEYIPDGTFRNLSKLTRLFLNNNRLTTFPGDASYLYKLQKLTLNANRIREITWTSFMQLKQLRFAALWNNSMTCDCNTYELIRWFTRTASGRAVNTGTPISCPEVVGGETCTSPTVTGIRFEGNDGNYTVGEDATMHCDVEGIPHPLINWRTPGAGYVFPYREDRITVYSNGTLVVKNLTRSDGGTYICVAQLSSRRTRNQLQTSIRILNAVAPLVAIESGIIEVNVGDRAEMRCNVVAGIPTPVITWFAPDDTSALDHENITSGAVELRDSGATLVVVESKQSDSGWWRCTASNVEGSSEGRIRLSVKSRSTKNSSVIIIAAAAAAGLLLVIVVATAAICICRRKRKKMAGEKESPAKVEETKAEEQGPPAKIEEEAYEPRFLPGSEQLQQPFEHVPEVRGFRL